MNLRPILESGPQRAADGDLVPPGLGEGSAALFGGLHGKYVGQGLRGLVFCSCGSLNPQGFDSVTSTTPPPLSLYNIASSKKYVSVIRWEIVVKTAPVAPVIGAYMFLVVTSPSVISANFEVRASVISKTRNNSSQPSQAPNLIVGTLYRPFVNHLAGATTTFPNDAAMFMDFDGTCILSPNTGLYLQQLNIDGSDAIPESKVTWEEFPFT